MSKQDSNTVTEQVLNEQLVGLNHEMTPNRDLWPGIERAIAQHTLADNHTNRSASGQPSGQHSSGATNTVVLEQSRWSMRTVLPMAASFFVAAILLTVLLPNNPFGNHSFGSNMQPVVQVLEQDFAAQKQAMLVSFGTPKLSELPPDMQEQLNQLASARATIVKALNDDPDNLELINLLRWTQAQELALLEQLYTPSWQTI